MPSQTRFVVDIVNREDRDTLTRLVETPFGEYKAAAVALLGIRHEYPDLHYGRITVREWAPGDLDDPHRTLVDPWADSATDST